MRASQLLHRSLPVAPAAAGDPPGAAALRSAGFVVPLGPGLLAGSALLQRTLGRLQQSLRHALADTGAEEVALPASEGEALLNLLAHLGWIARPAPAPAFALGAGFRDQAPASRGLFDAHLYPRLDVVLVGAGGDVDLRALEATLVGALARVGLSGVLAAKRPAPSGSSAPAGGRAWHLVAALAADAADAAAAPSSGDSRGELSGLVEPLGRLALRPLDGAGSRAAVLADLDLFAVIGAVAARHVDERGLAWPAALAPFDVAVIPAADEAAGALDAAAKVAVGLERAGLAVLFDDRPRSPAEKRADAEAWGLPLRVLCGPSAERQVVLEERRGAPAPRRIATETLLSEIEARLGPRAPASGSRTRRRAAF